MSMKLFQAKKRRKVLEDAVASDPHSYRTNDAYISALAEDAATCKLSLKLLLAALEKFATLCPLDQKHLTLWRNALNQLLAECNNNNTNTMMMNTDLHHLYRASCRGYEEHAWWGCLPFCSAAAFTARCGRCIPSFVSSECEDGVEGGRDEKLQMKEKEETGDHSRDEHHAELLVRFHATTQALNAVPLLLHHSPAEARKFLRRLRCDLDTSNLALSDDPRCNALYEQLMRRCFSMELAYGISCCSSPGTVQEEEEGKEEEGESAQSSILDLYREWEVDEKRVAEFTKRVEAPQLQPSSSHGPSCQDVVASAQLLIRQLGHVLAARGLNEEEAEASSSRSSSNLKQVLDELDALRGVCVASKHWAVAIMLLLRTLSALFFADVAVMGKTSSEPVVPPYNFVFPHCSRGSFMHFCSLLHKYVTFGFSGDDAPPFQFVSDIFVCAWRLFYAHSFLTPPPSDDARLVDVKAEAYRTFLVSHGAHVLHELRKDFVSKRALPLVQQESAWRVMKDVMASLLLDPQVLAPLLITHKPQQGSTPPPLSSRWEEMIVRAERGITACEISLLCQTLNDLKTVNYQEVSDMGHLLADLTDHVQRIADGFFTAAAERYQKNQLKQQEDVNAGEETGQGEGGALLPVEAAADVVCMILFSAASIVPHVKATASIKKAHEGLRRSLRAILDSRILSPVEARRVLSSWRGLQTTILSLGHEEAVNLVDVDFQLQHYASVVGAHGEASERHEQVVAGDAEDGGGGAGGEQPPRKVHRAETLLFDLKSSKE